MRAIRLIILHCSDDNNPNHDNIKYINDMHIHDKGFKEVGYHYFIRKNGMVEEGRPISEVGAHCMGYNHNSIGICLSGKREFTDEQFKALAKLIDYLKKNYKLKNTDIYGHNDFNHNKACPVYDVVKFKNEYLEGEL